MTGFLIVSLGFFVGVAGILFWENRRTSRAIAAARAAMEAEEERARHAQRVRAFNTFMQEIERPWRDQVRMDVERYRRNQQHRVN